MIHLENITKSFANGSEQMLALKGVSLHIEAGEFIAIVGQSGSGKSTLMNIIGCLDTLTSGSYKLGGKDITHFSPDELSELRLKKFGFIFQRYNLISANNALENVALPAIYAGSHKDERTARALELLDMLGLKGKEYQNPNKLSGGQQQRVSIARALMNGGEILLCDEPTGALDSASGEMVLKILKELNAKGHTIIMVTHDKGIASHANRIIEIKDGQIICDEKKDAKLAKLKTPKLTYSNNLSALKAELSESLAMSIGAIKAHKLRSFLTMLGIIIGITSVICVVALAKGSQESIIESINKMGTNTIQINPGRGPGDRNSAKVKRFNVDDAKMLEKLDFVDYASPIMRTSAELIYANKSSTGLARAGNEKILQISGVELESGRNFTKEDVLNSASVMIIDQNTKKEFFQALKDDEVIGQNIIFAGHPFSIIGIAKKDEGPFGDTTLSVYLPYTTVTNRLTGDYNLRQIIVSIKNNINSQLAEQAISDILLARRGARDFHMRNSDTILQTIKATTDTMGLLISGVALISLLVGGIGVMNIMLVSVIERTKEIGVRMAIGAKGKNIMLQFLIEAVLLCALGGAVGVALAFAIGWLINLSGIVSMIFSLSSVLVAFGISSAIGIIFGYMPAKSASRLNPIDALQRE
ncbi:MacB family efflux pump subunit [Campylobacter sp. 50012-21]|uniref:MacB family efflux pump subunit n=1 Tax=Campylobacter magnus TaxID=3026462 RepID=UPI0023625B7B|nr:MacB family efflux pump subunit [Campylobacter magnus]MDD0846359.1 MacB family efflux pump subunit [Campylobacter magnus]